MLCGLFTFLCCKGLAKHLEMYKSGCPRFFISRSLDWRVPLYWLMATHIMSLVMQLKLSHARRISNLRCNRIVFFLLFVNILSNGTALLWYHNPRNMFEILAISAISATIEYIIYHILKKFRLNVVYLLFIVMLHLFLCIVDCFLIAHFQKIFGQDAVDIIAETTIEETKSFLSTYLATGKTIAAIVIPITLTYLFWKLSKPIAKSRLAALLIVLLSISGAVVYAQTIYNYAIYRNGMSVPQLHSFTRAGYSLKILKDRERQINQLRLANQNIIATTDISNAPTVIVVIGESFSTYHSSLYGYEKETNPKLSLRLREGSLSVFKDVVTISDHTEGAMCSLFSLNDKGQPFYSAQLYPCIYRAAGYKTTMLDNQYIVGNGITFLTDKKLSDMMFNSRNARGMGLDENLVNYISFGKTPQLIVIHLMGQHYTYSDRYPKNYAHFKAKDYISLPSTQREIVAHYDNSILYNDYVLDQIITKAQDKDCILIYFSDHGEEIYEVDDYMGHGNAANRPDATLQLHVPLMIWTSDTFMDRHSELTNLIKTSVNKAIITDDLPFFLIDIANIQTDCAKLNRSFIREQYSSEPRIVLHSINYEEVKQSSRTAKKY